MTNNAVNVYAKYPRELKRLSNLDINKYNELTKNHPKCDIFIASFHERNFEKNIKKIFKNVDNFEIIIAPNVLDKNSKSGAILVEKKK